MKLLLMIILVNSLANCQWSGDGSGGWNDDDDDDGSGDGDEDDDGFSGNDYDEVWQKVWFGDKDTEGEESSGLGKDVIELTDENFRKKVLMEEETGWLVDFYAPWCGHSKRLVQPWADAATRLKGKMNLGALDAIQHESTADQFDIQVQNLLTNSLTSCVFLPDNIYMNGIAHSKIRNLISELSYDPVFCPWQLTARRL